MGAPSDEVMEVMAGEMGEGEAASAHRRRRRQRSQGRGATFREVRTPAGYLSSRSPRLLINRYR